LRENKLKKEVQKWLKGLYTDPITKILVKNSNLTNTQLETLLIDILAQKITGKTLSYEEKGHLRLLKAGTSRGAFNRTLSQSKRNIIKSVYTIILLGYLGVFETSKLDPLIEISNKIQEYANTYRDLWKKNKLKSKYLDIIQILQKDLENNLTGLSKPKNITK